MSALQSSAVIWSLISALAYKSLDSITKSMQPSKVRNLLVSAACNAEYEAIDWFDRLVAYGAANLVVVGHVDAVKVVCAMCGHTGRVNNVKFLKTGEILSACADGKVILFRNVHFGPNKSDELLHNEEHWDAWKEITRIDLKKRNIVQFSLLELEDVTYAAFLTTESDLHLARIDSASNKITVIDKLIFGNNLLESSTLFRFKGVNYMFVSGSDFMVHAYSFEAGTGEAEKMDGRSFKFLNSLKGHEDKVKSLASTVCQSDSEEIALVASGSKDSFIKVWRITEGLTDKVQSEFIKKNIYKVGSHYCHLESNLFGHNDAVSSVQWSYLDPAKAGQESSLVLLSSSLDFSLQLWQREAQSKVDYH